MSALRKKLPTLMAVLLVSASLQTSAWANLAPTTKPLEGENSLFPKEFMAPPKAPAQQAPAGAQGPVGAQAAPATNATVASVTPVAVAALDLPLQRPALPLFWVVLMGALSAGGMVIAGRMILRSDNLSLAKA